MLEKAVGMLLAGHGRGGVEMDGQRRPALRDDSGEAAAGAGVLTEGGQKEAEFRRDAGPGLVLQTAFAQYALRNSAVADKSYSLKSSASAQPALRAPAPIVRESP